MTFFVNDNGVWKEPKPYVKHLGVWKEAQEKWVNDTGTWKQVFANVLYQGVIVPQDHPTTPDTAGYQVSLYGTLTPTAAGNETIQIVQESLSGSYQTLMLLTGQPAGWPDAIDVRIDIITLEMNWDGNQYIGPSGFSWQLGFKTGQSLDIVITGA